MLFECPSGENILSFMNPSDTNLLMATDAGCSPEATDLCCLHTVDAGGWPPLARCVLGILQVPSIASAFILQ